MYDKIIKIKWFILYFKTECSIAILFSDYNVWILSMILWQYDWNLMRAVNSVVIVEINNDCDIIVIT